MALFDSCDPTSYGDDPATWPERLVVAATIFGEARGETMDAMLAVGMVIRHRALRPSWWGRGWAGVCLKKYQFSCWLAGDPNRVKCMNPLAFESEEVWLRCLAAATVVMGLDDPRVLQLTARAHSYYDRSLDGRPPAWRNEYKELAQVGVCAYLQTRYKIDGGNKRPWG